MGNYVFSYCTSLTNATIPGSITSVGDEAFEFCTSLTSVNIPNAVTSIGYYAFGGCSSLTSVAIPGRVTTIGDAAFAACTSLTNVTIGGGVTNVGFEALDSCTSLIAITVDATNDSFSSLDGVLLNKSQNTLIAFPGGKAGGYSIPGTVTSIGDGAFVGSTGLTSITISGSLTNIGYLAFQSCTSLTSVTIVKGGINIGVGAFDSCGNLTAVFFQGNAPSVVGSQAFERSSAILYYLPGTSGWGATLDSRPTRLWNPLIQSSGVSSAGFGFNITGTADIPMVIEAAANLANRTWIPLQSLNLTNGAFYFSDPNWTNYPARFYRVRSP
jgi:hypothetical protein